MSKDIEKMLSSFEAARPFLRIGLVAKKNLFQGTAKKKVAVSGDVYMVCKVEIEESNGQITQAIVSEKLVEQWGITEDVLFYAASLVCAENRTPVMKSLQEFTGGIIEQAQDSPALYCLTNRQALEGAACICYPGVLDGIMEQLKVDGFWVLPSSIHEVIIVPGEWSLPTAMEYKEMVKGINETVVFEQDFLSDMPMYYDSNGLYAY